VTGLLRPSPAPQLGDLWLTRSEGFVGRAIRFGARIRYHGWRYALRSLGAAIVRRRFDESPDDPCWGNHVAVYVGNGQLIEALASGLTLSPVGNYPAGTFRVLALNATDGQRDDAVAFARAELAKHPRYGWLSIASIVVQLVTPTKLDLSWDGTMICSAFAARVWEHAGKTLPILSPGTTMPADLAFYAGAL
jgi:hypothetical protein